MTKIDYVKSLSAMVSNLLTGIWTVSEFRDNYYDFYLEQVPEDVLSDMESDYFGSLQEKLDWVDDAPDFESRNAGWLNHAEFIKWVEEKKNEIHPH